MAVVSSYLAVGKKFTDLKGNYSFSILLCVLCPGNDHQTGKTNTKSLFKP